MTTHDNHDKKIAGHGRDKQSAGGQDKQSAAGHRGNHFAADNHDPHHQAPTSRQKARAEQEQSCPMDLTRRSFFKALGLAGAAGATGAAAASCSSAGSSSGAAGGGASASAGMTASTSTQSGTGSANPTSVVIPNQGTGNRDQTPQATRTGTEFQSWADSAQTRRITFTGEHQAGIITPPPLHCTVIGLNLQVTGVKQLQDLLRTVTRLARSFVTAGTPTPLGITSPPADNGVLGAGWNPDELTITLGLGHSLFDSRFGLSDRTPAKLTAMEPFADDSLDPAQTGADISLQICANNRDTISHALREIMRATRGAWSLAWSKNGYRNPSRPSGTPRNHFGFKDGTANPNTADAHAMDSLVWADSGEPQWCKGGSYQVIRLIEMYTEFWDRITVNEQEGIFGRDRVTGAPLSGGEEFTAPDYGDDARGSVIPLDAHIRLANPRTPETADQMILRRAFNWDDGLRPNGTLDVGLIFICYQQDLQRQFITMQKRLEGEPLADYIRPVGGGYFFVPPGITSDDDYLGSGLFA